jgi:hypothetical protein
MREYRIDFFRGLALAIIFIDHVPDNFFSFLTPKNFGLSDAAEAFVLISGMSAAYAYYGKFIAGDAVRASGLAIRRAFILYVTQVAGTVAILGLFAGAALWFADPAILQQNNIAEFMSDPVRGTFGVFTLGHQLGYFNILPMYVTFLALLPAMMLVARIDERLVLGLSALLYLAAGTWRLNLPNFPTEGGWFFNPIAWQFLFVIGFVAGMRFREGRGIPFNAFIYGVALVWLLLSGIWAGFQLWGTLPDLPLPFLLYGADKTFLTAGRLLHVLALAYVIGHSPVMPWLKARLHASNAVVALGRHGLVTFGIGTFLSMIGLILRQHYGSGFFFDTAIIVVGLSLLVGIARGLDYLGSRGKPPVEFQGVARSANQRHFLPAE